MHKAPLAIGLIILVALMSMLFILRDFIAPLMNMVFYIILGTFIVIFGFMLGIRYLSEIGK